MTLADESGARASTTSACELPAGWKTSRDRHARRAATGAPNHYLRAGLRHARRLPDRRRQSRRSTSSPSTASRTCSSTSSEGGVFDGARAARDLERIVKADEAFWGCAALRQVRLLQPAHRDERRARAQELRDDDGEPLGHAARESDYLDWLSLASHEYFHLWNVKRLRPDRAGAVRLRARELSAQPVDLGRADRLLRRSAAGARRPAHRAGNTSRSCRRRSARCRRRRAG